VTCEIVPARLTHVGPIASRMRALDRMECEALGRTPKDALRNGLRCSLAAYTALVDGRPVAMLGVVSGGLLGGPGKIWMLGTDEVMKQGRALLFYGPILFELWLETFTELGNIVAVENRPAIRLLKRWGFEVDEDQPDCWGGCNFVRFRMKRGRPKPPPEVQSVTLTCSMGSATSSLPST
jgi:hypothetical protein